MPTVLYFNVFLCTCGDVFKEFDEFNKHQKNGCKLACTKHIVYDSKSSIKERVDVKPGISLVGYK